ncbi:MAG: hypothetical protein DMF82_15730 [Acidobacteria bacterium]|nr:MAG: hypothetical protein DMF82_15730 [Acidobacteriota bacterium]
MSKMTRTMTTLVAGLVAAANLQAAPLPGFVLTAQTQHFSFYSRDNQKVDSQKTERYLAQVEQLLGQQVEGRAEYYRYASAQELAAGTGTYAAGLTLAHSGQIHSTQAFHAHEIVHLVAGQMGNPGVFFQEGLAVAGSFVNRLIKTHGIAKVAEFFRACGPNGGNPSVAFARTFGQSLDEAGAAWAASL